MPFCDEPLVGLQVLLGNPVPRVPPRESQAVLVQVIPERLIIEQRPDGIGDARRRGRSHDATLTLGEEVLSSVPRGSDDYLRGTSGHRLKQSYALPLPYRRKNVQIG